MSAPLTGRDIECLETPMALKAPVSPEPPMALKAPASPEPPISLEELVEVVLAQHPHRTGQALGVLNDLQRELTYLPHEALKLVARKTGIGLQALEAMADFFRDYSREPLGKHIVEICDGTACHSLGAMRLVSFFEDEMGLKVGCTTEDGLITLRAVRCVGACSLAPVVSFGESMQGHVRPYALRGLLEDMIQGQA